MADDLKTVHECAWDERPFDEREGCLWVVEACPNGEVQNLYFCSHGHLQKWVAQVIEDCDREGGRG